ncbi:MULTISPECIES: DUF1918 domain-containing protein [Nocardiopsis]|uniref:DUF1918 domain-containing protein n=1 Tax=Nocardiopsis sinuspersici TaxID=501010 RepID=A0A1V3C3V2_9ACTN|nr:MULTISPECIES: DUF1918 domain-containing protein [Nocardiopsis]NYH51585.1 hypothetical protein [Nocardiopsis sinuspersici]OOC55206.1 DUF1918 domain-containing protein [Nocardiopsis sinuspersici]
MQASVGDRVLVHGGDVGRSDRRGEVIEVRGPDGDPPYLVRFSDGQESLVCPGPDAVVEHLPPDEPGAARPAL